MILDSLDQTILGSCTLFLLQLTGFAPMLSPGFPYISRDMFYETVASDPVEAFDYHMA